jgi:probable phosphomutase (TIGR03848 family)
LCSAERDREHTRAAQPVNWARREITGYDEVNVTTVILVRHGLTAETGSTLSGWTPGLHLDERGRTQAAALAEALRELPLTAVVSSPLERCVETASALLDGRTSHGKPVGLQLDERLGEVRFGEWTGRSLRDLAKEPLWTVVQAHPSAAVFPAGESLREMQARAVGAIREWNVRLGPDAVYVACSHGDPIRAIVADALGMHLDQFHRLAAGPCSVTVIRYTDLRPVILLLNGTGAAVSDRLALNDGTLN